MKHCIMHSGYMCVRVYFHVCRDSTAASCVKAVRAQLAELEAEQQVLSAEVKAEAEVQENISQLRYERSSRAPTGTHTLSTQTLWCLSR